MGCFHLSVKALNFFYSRTDLYLVSEDGEFRGRQRKMYSYISAEGLLKKGKKKELHTFRNFCSKPWRVYRIFSSLRFRMTFLTQWEIMGGAASLHLKSISHRANRAVKAMILWPPTGTSDGDQRVWCECTCQHYAWKFLSRIPQGLGKTKT